MFQQIFTKSLVILMVSLGLSGCGHTADIKIDQNIPLDVLKNEAEKSNPDAQCWLAICYSEGLQGTVIDKIKSQELFQKLAKNNNEELTSVQFGKAVCYLHGYRISKDKAEAVKWFRKAAEQGFAPAQNILAFCYDNGEGVEKNTTEAVKWYRRAAEQGSVESQYNLALSYDNGDGVTKNRTEAVKWYRRAAEQGLAQAQYNLAVCYYNGDGVEKNMAEAVKWFRKAAEQGFDEAKKRLQELGY